MSRQIYELYQFYRKNLIMTTDSIVNFAGHFILIISRIGGIFALTPVFGQKQVVSVAKICLCIAFAYILIPIVPTNYTSEVESLYGFISVCLREILVGLCFGFVTLIFVSSVIFAGYIIDFQVGFSIMQVFDLQFNDQTPVSGQLLNIILVWLMLVTDSHLVIIRLMVDSYNYFGIGASVFRPELAWFFLDLFISMLVIGIKIAMPVIAAGLIAEVCFGIIVRTIPQMNIFVVGVPLKLILGVLVFYLIIPLYVSMTQVIFDNMFLSIENLFKELMAP